MPRHRRAAPKGGTARRPQPLRLGLAAVDHPDDPQASAADLYGFLEDKDQMPAFGADQLTANDVDDGDPLPQERLRQTRRRARCREVAADPSRAQAKSP